MRYNEVYSHLYSFALVLILFPVVKFQVFKPLSIKMLLKQVRTFLRYSHLYNIYDSVVIMLRWDAVRKCLKEL